MALKRVKTVQTTISHSESLTKLFDDLNERFFDGKLPRYTVCETSGSPIPSFGAGLCCHERQVIYLRPDLDPGSQREVLLHEMCHIGVTGHGQQFKARLAHLAECGEKWATQHLKRLAVYRDDMTDDQIRQQAAKTLKKELLALVRKYPHLVNYPFSRILEDFAKYCYTTPTELSHPAYGLQALWRKLTSDRQEKARDRSVAAETTPLSPRPRGRRRP